METLAVITEPLHDLYLSSSVWPGLSGYAMMSEGKPAATGDNGPPTAVDTVCMWD